MKKTTAGWDLEVEWKDGGTSWLPLKELKATNSVELAEYAVANRIDKEPAIDWWVRDTLKRKKYSSYLNPGTVDLDLSLV